MGLKSNNEDLCKRRADGGLGQTDRRHRERAWVVVESKTRGRRPPVGDSRSLQSRAETTDSLPEPLRGACPCIPLDSGLPASARGHASAILSCPVCSHLFEPLGAHRGQAVWGVFSKTQCIRLFAETVSEWEMLAPSSSPHSGFPGGSDSKESACRWVGRVPWRRRWQPIPVFAWRIPRTEEPGGLQPMESQRVRHN